MYTSLTFYVMKHTCTFYVMKKYMHCFIKHTRTVCYNTYMQNDVDFVVEVDEDPEQGKQPLHSMGVSLHTIECRMDYMGSSVLMARLNELRISMKDEWHVQNKPSSDTPLATNRCSYKRTQCLLSCNVQISLRYVFI